MKTLTRLSRVWILLLFASLAFGDAGVLIPLGQEQPDAAILSLAEMRVDIRIDNGDAHVEIRQIYESHVDRILEGNYVFALPSRALVSGFAIWDGVTRIPGVILERKRAEEIYNDLKWQAIDPGLLQMGERDADEARRGALFSARVVPIPSYGSKRVEIEYHETIPVDDLQSTFALPLHPGAYHAVTAGHITINFELDSQHTLSDFQSVGTTFPLKITDRNPHLVKGTFEGDSVLFKEDFAVKYTFDASKTDSLQMLTYRDPAPSAPDAVDMQLPAPNPNEPGFFAALALFAAHNSKSSSAGSAADEPPRTVLVMMDTSLSMQWDKLERSYQAMETLLHALRPADHFNLMLFNTEVSWFEKQSVAADAATVDRALQFVRSGTLRGGTNLQQALGAALAQSASASGDSYIVLLSDGDATRGPIATGKLAAWYTQKWKSLPEASRPRTYVFGVGDDANQVLLRQLASQRGVMEWVRSTEPIAFKLNAFLGKIGRDPLGQLSLSASPPASFDMVYPLENIVFPGSAATWVGQYTKPGSPAQFDVQATREGSPVKLHASLTLPVRSVEHPNLPRAWAKARVDALLAKIERDGEDAASVDEIIRLARKYKFVTPYTSFLAAPRALLRPRVIRPGDPVIRVKTDASINSVVALFPFGLIKPLRYLPDEDIWQTRFLAPTDMSDGTYVVRLIMRDQEGHVYRESKSFVIVTHPPTVRVWLNKKQFRRGETIPLKVSASAQTRTVLARLYGADPAFLTWNESEGANTGDMVIPTDLPAGRYTLTVTAEDIAHNMGSQEVAIDVLP